MNDWIETLDGFLKLSKYDILSNAGRISAAMAEKKAKEEYHKFRALQDEQLGVVDKDFIAALENAEEMLTNHKSLTKQGTLSFKDRTVQAKVR